MKRAVVLIAGIFWIIPCILAAQTESANLVKNGDFENFKGDDPVDWETSNVPGSLTVVSADRLAHGGRKGVRCDVKDFYGTKIAGYVCQKNISLTGRNLQLSGYCVMNSVGKDAGVVIVCFVSAGGATLGTVEEYFRASTKDFVRFTRDLEVPAEATTCQVRLTILSDPEGEGLHAGSYAVFDDVKLVVVPPKPKPVVQ
jgi:hypothetical protein